MAPPDGKKKGGSMLIGDGLWGDFLQELSQCGSVGAYYAGEFCSVWVVSGSDECGKSELDGVVTVDPEVELVRRWVPPSL
jgi:hypothetical protein